MCGVIGIHGKANTNVSTQVYDGMISLQHRGHDAAGLVSFDGSQFHTKKGVGFVRDIFDNKNMTRLQGHEGLGFIRYATAGGMTIDDAAPFTVSSPYGISMVFNGNVTNFAAVKKELEEKDLVKLNANSDIEAMLHVFAQELRKRSDMKFEDALFDTVKAVHKRCKGAYSAIAIIAGKGMVAFRDPLGIRPLMLGKRKNGRTDEYIFASESVMFTMLDFDYVDDVRPGEAVYINNKNVIERKQVTKGEWKPCLFEYVYFARPDSIQNNISVYKSRLRMGEKLGERIKPMMEELNIDVVSPVPSSSTTSALALAQNIGVPYREALVKNHFIGRTFIMAGNENRKKSVRYKLNPQLLEVRRKNVLLVDDSIVRGNTIKEIIKMIREAGAKNVYVASAAPPVIAPCVYGVDMPTKEEFIANQVSYNKKGGADALNEAIRKHIGADYLIYQTIEDLVDAVRIEKGPATDFCAACFTGKYPSKEVDKKLLDGIAKERIANANSAHC